ncbi:MAG: glycosyltransferase family 4 protein, partial [Candidatus Acidiferrales bacterium]
MAGTTHAPAVEFAPVVSAAGAFQSAEVKSAPALPLRDETPRVTLCHFTASHAQLKSRSYHRECLPLSASGVGIRYVSPARTPAAHGTPGKQIECCTIPRRDSRLRRALAAPSLLRTLLRQRAGIYHFQDPELLPVAFALKTLFRKRVIYDAYEEFPSMALHARAIPPALRSLAAKLIAATERMAARTFDGVMTADPFTLRRLARTGKSHKLVFYNFPNLDYFPPPSPVEKPFDLVYRGGLSERAGTYVLLDALNILAARGISAKLLLLGYFDGPSEEAALRRRIQEFGLAESVTLRGRIDHEEMAAALTQARIGISPLQAIPKFLLNIPVKIFEYWACGLPVIASDLPSIRPFFRNVRAGILFNQDDVQALARSIAWMLDHHEEAAAMGRQGR